MPPKIKVSAMPGNDCECFDVSFFDGSDQLIGSRLKKLFAAAGWSVKERRPDGKTVVWEVNLPIGDIVTNETMALVKHSVDAAVLGQNCRIIPSY